MSTVGSVMETWAPRLLLLLLFLKQTCSCNGRGF
jgi:hypothetical protein